MSETPIIPAPEHQSEQIATNVEQRYYTGNVDRDFAAWERGFDTARRLDLDREEALNPELWADKAASATQAPEYATAPKTHAEEVAESLRGLSDRELRAQLDAHTKTIVNGLRKHILVS